MDFKNFAFWTGLLVGEFSQINRWFFPAWGKQKWGGLHQKRVGNLFQSIFTTSDAWPLDSKSSTLFECQSPNNQYHNPSQSFSICCICVNWTILAFCLFTKINKMWYHFDIWVETSQLSPNASPLSTITLALSLTPICFQGNMHHIWSLTFVDENIDESTIRWLRWRGRRYYHNIWAGVVLPVRGIEEIRLMLSSASNGNNVANPFFHQYSRKFFNQTHFFIFSKHNQICETVSESFWFFSTLRVSCL